MTPSLTVDDGQSRELPRRVLVVSADIGGGHHATGRALQERVQRLWPGSPVRWVDTLDAMGPGVGRALRRTYTANVEVTPWLYEFFYASLWRYRWFADASKWFVGAWAGRGLRPVVEGFDPDVIVSTYPMGSAGLAWLRRRFGLGVPVGAWVSDFAPHPFWVYSEIDLNVLAHPAALPLAAAAAPGAPIATCEPPVASRFRPGDRGEARRGWDLDPARPVVLVACGSLGFGAVEEAVRALTGLGGLVQVVAVCGRNQLLAGRLSALGEPADRLRVLEWVDDMPTLLAAADLLVTNAGGATALEAMATGTPVLMYRPIAAHGAANAALMSACGLAETCHSPSTLAAWVRRRLCGDAPDDARADGGGAGGGARGRAAVGGGAVGGVGGGVVGGHLPDLGLPALAGAPSAVAARPGRRVPSWPVRGRDAFLLDVEAATLPQQTGAVIEFGPRPDGRALDVEALTDLLAQRMPAIAVLRRRLVGRGGSRRPGWVIDRRVDAAAQIEEYRIPGGPARGVSGGATVAEGDGVNQAIERFWARPLPADRQPWRVLLVTGGPGGRTTLAVKLHRSLGDETSAIGTVRRLLDPAPVRVPAGQEHREEYRSPAGTAMGRAWRALRAVPGLVVAARGGLTVPGRPPATVAARLVTTTLPDAVLTRAARGYGADPGEVACALVAEALRRAWPAGAARSRLSAMLTVPAPGGAAAPAVAGFAPAGTILWSLPAGAATMPARVAEVRDGLRYAREAGQPAAVGLLVRVAGWLPAPVRARLARRVHLGRFVDAHLSYQDQSTVDAGSGGAALAGAPVRAVTPVVSLTGGVRASAGILRRAGRVEVGVLLDASVAAMADAFVAALRDAAGDLSGAVPQPPARPPAESCAQPPVESSAEPGAGPAGGGGGGGPVAAAVARGASR